MSDQPDRPLSHPIEIARLPQSGLRLELSTSEAARRAVAEWLGILGVEALAASLQVAPRGGRVAVKGRLAARVVQACVVTLEPVEEQVDEEIDLVFASPEEVAAAEARAFREREDGTTEILVDQATLLDPDTLPEPIENGRIDAWALALETLSLGLNPYPRKPGAEFAQPAPAEPEPSPFAALAKLKKD